jgi:hypothetical protein
MILRKAKEKGITTGRKDEVNLRLPTAFSTSVVRS